jgi:putative transposase
VLGVPAVTYRAVKSRPRSPRRRRDEQLKAEILRVYNANLQVYGARKIWRQLRREGHVLARCTVERLMRDLGIAGVVRGRRMVTTIADPARPIPEDLLKRDFTAPAPNVRWVADLTEVATWSGKAYCAFVIDCFSRFIVGWRIADHMRTDLRWTHLKWLCGGEMSGMGRRSTTQITGRPISADPLHHNAFQRRRQRLCRHRRRLIR